MESIVWQVVALTEMREILDTKNSAETKMWIGTHSQTWQKVIFPLFRSLAEKELLVFKH